MDNVREVAATPSLASVGRCCWRGELRQRHYELSWTPVRRWTIPRSPDALADRLREFHRGLKDASYIERENVIVSPGGIASTLVRSI